MRIGFPKVGIHTEQNHCGWFHIFRSRTFGIACSASAFRALFQPLCTNYDQSLRRAVSSSLATFEFDSNTTRINTLGVCSITINKKTNTQKHQPNRSPSTKKWYTRWPSFLSKSVLIIKLSDVDKIPNTYNGIFCTVVQKMQPWTTVYV